MRIPIAVLATLILASSAAPQSAKPAKLTTIAELKGVRVEDALVSPNGKFIAYTTAGELHTLDIAKHTTTTLAKGPAIDIFSWSPASDAIAFVRERDAHYAGYLWSQPVDPATGAAAGSAQRVSMTKIEDSGMFSPDGKSIAIVTTSEDPTLIVVPATGGRERVVAHLPFHADVSSWSADGRKIYLMAADRTPGRAGWNLDEVNVSDGARKRIMPVKGCMLGARGSRYFVDFGCSPAGRDTVLRLIEGNGRIAGTFSVPIGPQPETLFPGNGGVLLKNIVVPVTLDVVSLADGSRRDLGPIGSENRAVAWSPDAKRIALATLRDGHPEIVIMNADGSARREYPVPTTIPMELGIIRWSPDGRFVAFLSDSGRAISALDVGSGAARTIVSATSPFRAGIFEWTPDSRAVHYLHRPEKGIGAGQFTMREATVDGADRELKDVTPYITAGMRWARLVADSMYVVISKDTTFIVPTTGTGARRFPAEGMNRWNPGASANGEMIASAYVAPGGTYEYRAIELLSTRDGTRRILPMPFEVSTGPSTVPFFLPDGKHLAVVSAATATEPKRLWLVSLDGEQPRPIAVLSESTLPTYMDLSPDGRSLVFTRPGTPTTTFIKADFSAALKR